MSEVIYKEIPEFPGYKAGDDGSIWSSWTTVSIGKAGFTKRQISNSWKRLKPSKIGKRGVQHVSLCKNGRTFQKSVPRLILETFVGPCPTKMECCHFPDRDCGNNKLSNLRWGTRESNIKDKFIHKTTGKGEKNPRAKLTEEQVIEIRELSKEGYKDSILAKMFNVSKGLIWFIKTKKNWSHI